MSDLPELKEIKIRLSDMGKPEAEIEALAINEFERNYGITYPEAQNMERLRKSSWKFLNSENRKNGLLIQGVRFEQTGSDEERIIEGFCSVEIVDRHETIVSTQAILDAAEEYMALSKGKIRVQHRDVPVGKVLEIQERTKIMPDGKKYRGVWIKAEILKGFEAADDTWQMIKTGALEGFSIGFDSVAETFECPEKDRCFPKIVKIHWIETSVVDLPSNPGAFFENVRMAYKPMTDILSQVESREIMKDTKSKRQEEAPPAAPPAEVTPPAEPTDMEKLIAMIEGIASKLDTLTARVDKIEGGGEEAPPEAPPAESAETEESRGVETTNVGEPEKQLAVALDKITTLKAEVSKLTSEATEPDSQAPGATSKKTISLEVPDDLRNWTPDDVNNFYLKQKEVVKASKRM